MQLKKILLRAPNWVGDSAVATPAIKAIRARFPDAEITVMVRPSVAGVFASARYVDRVWSEPKPSGLREWMRITRAVRQQHFDLAVLFPNSFESAAMVFLGGVRQRVGYAMDSRGWMLTHRVPGEKRKVHHVNYYLELAKAVSADVSKPSMEITARQEDRTNARKLLAVSGIPLEQRFMILSPGAAFGAAKRWGDQQFAEAADKLAEEFKLAVVIIGS
jgi:heptosyltransferase-2